MENWKPAFERSFTFCLKYFDSILEYLFISSLFVSIEGILKRLFQSNRQFQAFRPSATSFFIRISRFPSNEETLKSQSFRGINGPDVGCVYEGKAIWELFTPSTRVRNRGSQLRARLCKTWVSRDARIISVSAVFVRLFSGQKKGVRLSRNYSQGQFFIIPHLSLEWVLYFWIFLPFQNCLGTSFLKFLQITHKWMQRSMQWMKYLFRNYLFLNFTIVHLKIPRWLF